MIEVELNPHIVETVTRGDSLKPAADVSIAERDKSPIYARILNFITLTSYVITWILLHIPIKDEMAVH